MGYWRDYPPTHLLVRAHLGAGGDGGAGGGAASAGHSDEEMDAFFAALGGRGSG
jgi:hypothetical protein